MPNTLVRDAVARAVNLIPFDAGSIRGEAVWVLTSENTVPPRFIEAQQERTATYMATGDRLAPGHAPRYYVASGDILLAWVLMDGSVHYLADDEAPTTAGLTATQRKHREAIRAAWPTRFAVSFL